jgi:hypothetical protein
LIDDISEDELIVPHQVNWDSPKITTSLQSICDIEEFDERVFAKWRIADLSVMFAAGFIGTLTSGLLRQCFADYHDAKGRKPTVRDGHSGENIDWVPGNKQPGGFGHRWQYGHDMLNPFEVDWEQYKELARQSGSSFPTWMKALFYWGRHLFQDSFSKEGLPLPSHSLLREWLDPAKNRELLQIMGTIKARDIAGSGVTNVIMGGYVWGTEKSFKRTVCEPNYRGFSLMLGANVTNLLLGLLAPPPYTSFNWSTVPIIGYYSWQLIKMERQVREALRKRDQQLTENDRKLYDNFSIISDNDSLINAMETDLEAFEKEVEAYYQQVIKNHNELKRRILK